MALVRATCADCGDIELPACDVTVVNYAAIEEFAYRFDCPLCGESHERPCHRRVYQLLLTGGAQAPASEADVIDVAEIAAFRYAMGDDAAVAEALADLS